MTISDLYDIEKILLNLEVALLIDGNDYANKNVDSIISEIKKRIIRQYHVDLTDKKIDDESLCNGRDRGSVILFIENIGQYHAQLAAYLDIVGYANEIKIKPIKVSYVGLEEESLMSILRRLARKKTMASAEQAIQVLAHNMAYIEKSIEKRVLLIMIVAYELGFYELCAVCAEILYIGNKLS